MKSVLKLLVCSALIFSFSCEKETLESNQSAISENNLFLDREKDDDGGCETAYAFDKESICFADDDDLNSNKWGWSLGPITEGYTGSFDIYQGAGQCNLLNGDLIGTLSVSYVGGIVNVDYAANDGYAFFETHLFVGDEKYPRKNNGQFTVAPGQYGNTNSYTEGTSNDSYTLTNISGEIYIIAHAVVCEVKKEECVANAGVLKADSKSYCLDKKGEATISASPDGGLVVPDGYSVIYVLTEGNGLIIQAVSDSPSFVITSAGDFTIHTLVYDPETLDLSIVQFGITTGFDVLDLIELNDICASLDAIGAQVKVDKCEFN